MLKHQNGTHRDWENKCEGYIVLKKKKKDFILPRTQVKLILWF